MWFKQVQLFQLTTPIKAIDTASISEKLEPLAFQDCIPSMPFSSGWASPLEEDDAPLTRVLNGCFLLCLQIEEKILPATVVRDAVNEKVKLIELTEARKIRQKEKLNLKDEMTQTLLPRAFSRYSRLYAYVDTRNQWLVLNTTSPKKTELFMSMFKKSFGEGVVASFDTVKPSAVFTHWLKTRDYPTILSVEKSCVLQDPEEQTRIIRCQEQDLFDSNIQSFVKDKGCEVMQIGMCWQDRLNFTLANDFSIRNIRRTEDDLAEMSDIIESASQKLDAYFFMMTEMFTGLFQALLPLFMSDPTENKEPLARVG